MGNANTAKQNIHLNIWNAYGHQPKEQKKMSGMFHCYYKRLKFIYQVYLSKIKREYISSTAKTNWGSFVLQKCGNNLQIWLGTWKSESGSMAIQPAVYGQTSISHGSTKEKARGLPVIRRHHPVTTVYAVCVSKHLCQIHPMFIEIPGPQCWTSFPTALLHKPNVLMWLYIWIFIVLIWLDPNISDI